MTQDEIIDMARQAGAIDISTTKGCKTTVFLGADRPEFLEAFAKLVAAKEREACRQDVRFADNGTEAAEIIRARGQA
jgi:hypothetical protein